MKILIEYSSFQSKHLIRSFKSVFRTEYIVWSEEEQQKILWNLEKHLVAYLRFLFPEQNLNACWDKNYIGSFAECFFMPMT